MFISAKYGGQVPSECIPIRVSKNTGCRVFWRGSAGDGTAVFDLKRVCTAEAVALLEKLMEEKEISLIYNSSIPRHEPGITPFNGDAKKWGTTSFA